VDPRAGLGDVKKIPDSIQGFELQSLGHPALSTSLYRLRYPGSVNVKAYDTY
jgi:hypothetical protein